MFTELAQANEHSTSDSDFPSESSLLKSRKSDSKRGSRSSSVGSRKSRSAKSTRSSSVGSKKVRLETRVLRATRIESPVRSSSSTVSTGLYFRKLIIFPVYIFFEFCSNLALYKDL